MKGFWVKSNNPPACIGRGVCCVQESSMFVTESLLIVYENSSRFLHQISFFFFFYIKSDEGTKSLCSRVTLAKILLLLLVNRSLFPAQSCLGNYEIEFYLVIVGSSGWLGGGWGESGSQFWVFAFIYLPVLICVSVLLSLLVWWHGRPRQTPQCLLSTLTDSCRNQGWWIC